MQKWITEMKLTNHDLRGLEDFRKLPLAEIGKKLREIYDAKSIYTAVVKIQSLFKMRWVRRKFLVVRKLFRHKLCFIQIYVKFRFLLRRLRRRRVEKRDKAVINVQRILRGYLTRKRLNVADLNR